MNFLNKHSEKIRNISHWTIFIFVCLTLSLKMVEVSAHESAKLIVSNPEIAPHSSLVNSNYLPF